MFLGSRIVIVDDKEHHLAAVKKALDALRLDCHSKLYVEDEIPNWSNLPGMRLLILDQNLIAGATFGTDNTLAFAAIADVIQKLVCPFSGPYGIILWAEEPQEDALKAFLYERLQGDDARKLPVFVSVLPKGDYIDTGTGEARDPQRLKQHLEEKIGESPQLRALFSWEADVVAAMDAVLRSIVDLVPNDIRSSDAFAEELGKVFYRLAQAGAGIEKAKENPREAINRVLVPILADRILEHDPQGVAADVWNDALTDIPEAEKLAPLLVEAAVNSAIHLSYARTENSISIQASDLGAVIEYPFGDLNLSLEEKFGISKNLLFDDKFFGLTEQEWEHCKLRLVQVGAACDHAQPKDGNLIFLLGIEWPYTNEDGSKANSAKLHKKKSQVGHEWRSPVICAGDGRSPGRISVFLNCPLGVKRGDTTDWVAAYRMREELISKLTQEYARHISRPGIVTLGSPGGIGAD